MPKPESAASSNTETTVQLSTGVVLYLDGLSRRTFRWSLLGASAVLSASLYDLGMTRDGTSAAAACGAFTCALLAWGWQELSFYMGLGHWPLPDPLPVWLRWAGPFPPRAPGHEPAILVSAGAVGAVTWDGANQVGTWTFLIPWRMHESARLNVFLGVPNVTEELLPAHLACGASSARGR